MAFCVFFVENGRFAAYHIRPTVCDKNVAQILELVIFDDIYCSLWRYSVAGPKRIR